MGQGQTPVCFQWICLRYILDHEVFTLRIQIDLPFLLQKSIRTPHLPHAWHLSSGSLISFNRHCHVFPLSECLRYFDFFMHALSRFSCYFTLNNLQFCQSCTIRCYMKHKCGRTTEVFFRPVPVVTQAFLDYMIHIIQFWGYPPKKKNSFYLTALKTNKMTTQTFNR